MKNSLDGSGLTKVPLDMPDGLGMSPRPKKEHQLAIANFIRNIGNEMVRRNAGYFPISETELGKANSETPDVTIYAHPDWEALLIIEVCHSRGQKEAFEKVPEMYKKYPSVREAFIYNYQTDKLYYLPKDGSPKKKDFTMLFGERIDLAKMAKGPFDPPRKKSKR